MFRAIQHKRFVPLVGLVLIGLTACQQQPKREMTPWGTPVDEQADTLTDGYTLSDIQQGGELIMLTLTGPETYYDYRGRGMGLQYLLCEQFAQQLGVKLRVEVCADTADMVRRLEAGDGDVIAFPLPQAYDGLDYCGYQVADSVVKKAGHARDGKAAMWAVRKGNAELADTLNRWFRPELVAKVQQEEAFMLSAQSVTRHVYSPMLSRSGGVISRFDHLFQQYSGVARWDWRLLAAQCYQESTFDPQARSWAGACGLMQIMPATAAHLGLPQAKIYEPEANIAAAAKYINELSGHFSDIQDRQERINFVLAAYNGGFFHIRDAMTLARKYGRNPQRWQDVSEFVLKLSQPQYYGDPVVKHGYMRGSETVGYVSRIRDRWAQYRGFARPVDVGVGITTTPHRASKKNKYDIKMKE
ncbi:MAG: transglycosylase SLT domain-containing protein [Prevotella sp.]|nr:transglycosylase SLT domain-containing protein [Prevotella sp.]